MWLSKHIKARPMLFGVAMFLFIVEIYRDSQLISCWDCGWDRQHSFLLLLAATGLWIDKLWSLLIAGIVSAREAYLIGHEILWRFIEMTETKEPLSNWPILRNSLSFTYDTRPDYFLSVIIAGIIFILTLSSFRAYLLNQQGNST